MFDIIKGSPIHEALHLPEYWWQLYSRRVGGLEKKRVTYGENARQYFLYFEPESPSPAPKVAIYIHGGGWRIGSPELFQPVAQFFGQLGYHTIMPSFRRLPHFNYKHFRQDIKECQRAILEFLGNQSIHDAIFLLGGMSSGGHLASMWLYDVLNEAPGYHDFPVSGLLLCGAPLNLDLMRDSPPLRMLAGKRGGMDFQSANPFEQVKRAKELPKVPVFCVHGECDGLVEFESALSFVFQLKKIPGQHVIFHSLDKGSHLDAGRWIFEDNETRKKLLTWMNETERWVEGKNKWSMAGGPEFAIDD